MEAFTSASVHRAAMSPGRSCTEGPAAWLKVGRVGDVVTGYASVDGKKWEPIGNAKFPVKHDLLAGLIATSRDNKAANAVRFDSVDITRSDAAFDGEAAPLPGVIQAERFDVGGAGYTFSAEYGEAGPVIERIPDAAGSESSAGGYFLKGMKANRYINYSVNVANDGDYVISVREASAEPVVPCISTSTRSRYRSRLRCPTPGAKASGAKSGRRVST